MSPAPSFPSQLQPPSVSPDIYNWDMRYRSVLRRLHSEDSGILEGNRLKIKKFLESREARGLSLPRVIKYGNHLITFSKCCSRHFDEMTQDDVREVLVSLKNRNKMDPRSTKMKSSWRGINGSKYSEVTPGDFPVSSVLGPARCSFVRVNSRERGAHQPNSLSQRITACF